MNLVSRWTTVLVPFVLLGLATVASPRVAYAQAEESQSEEEADVIERAQALYNRASQLYAERAYAEAVIFFEQALQLIQVPDLYYNVARSYERLAQYNRAIENFEAYLKVHFEQLGREAPDKTDVEATIRDLRRRAAPPEVRLTVTTEPPGANVFIDHRDAVRGQTPFEIELHYGVYTVILQADGFEEEEHRIELRRGEPQSLSFKLQRRTDQGALRFDINVRGAQIFVGGQVKGLTPYTEPIPVGSGRSQVTVQKDRYSTLSRVVEVTAGATEIVRGDLYLADPPGSWRGYLGWTFVGLGLLGVGGGVGVHLWADGRYFKEEQLHKDLALAQKLGYGIGGGLAGIGVALIIWEYARDAVDKADLVPRSQRLSGATPAPPPVSIHMTPDGGVGVSSQFLF